MTRFFDTLQRDRVLPLVTPQRPEDVVRALELIAAEGLGTLEVALRTPAALPGLTAAASVASSLGVMLGVGTVLTVEDLDRARDAGAAFAVTPGWQPAVVERAVRIGMPVLPGVATAGEVVAALGAGLDTVKLFPAEAIGGMALLRAFSGPFPYAQFVASGGITTGNQPAYLALPNVLAVCRSWALD